MPNLRSRCDGQNIINGAVIGGPPVVWSQISNLGGAPYAQRKVSNTQRVTVPGAQNWHRAKRAKPTHFAK